MKLKKPIRDSLVILKKSFKITNDNKNIWWLGFLIAITQNLTYISARLSFDPELQESFTQTDLKTLNNLIKFIHHNPEKSILILLLTSLALIVLYSLFQASIILSVKKILKEKEIHTKKLLISAKKFIKKMLLMDFSILMFAMSVLIVVSLPVYLLSDMGLELASNLMLIGAFLIALPVLLITYFTRRFAQIYLIQHNLSIKESLKNSYRILGNNLFFTGVFFLILTGILMLTEIIMFFILQAGYALPSSLGLLVLILVALDIIIKSAIMIFQRCAWVIFFNKITLREEKGEEQAFAPVKAKTTATITK
jgi:hypothetical protein